MLKKTVKVITAIAFCMVLVGGSALDSKNLLVPAVMIVPSLGWLALVAWANK